MFTKTGFAIWSILFLIIACMAMAQTTDQNNGAMGPGMMGQGGMRPGMMPFGPRPPLQLINPVQFWIVAAFFAVATLFWLYLLSRIVKNLENIARELARRNTIP